jgi:acyl carrier protein
VSFDDVLRRHLRALAPGAEIPPETPLRELGLNSLRAIELLLDLEATFEIAFPDDALTDENFRSAASLQRIVDSLINRDRDA